MRLGESAGLTLIECVAAAAVLLIAWTAASGTLVFAKRIRAEATRRAAAEREVTDLVERLRSVSFADRSTAEGVPAHDALDLVFPHAEVALNTVDAHFESESGDDWPAGSFLMQRRCGDVTLRSTACFVDDTRCGWRPVAVGEVAGRRFSDGDRPPTSALLVTITATWSRQGRSCTIERQLVILESALRVSAVLAVAAE